MEHLLLTERAADSAVLAFDEERGPFRLTYRLTNSFPICREPMAIGERRQFRMDLFRRVLRCMQHGACARARAIVSFSHSKFNVPISSCAELAQTPLKNSVTMMSTFICIQIMVWDTGGNLTKGQAKCRLFLQCRCAVDLLVAFVVNSQC
jgi:hypothetical protein